MKKVMIGLSVTLLLVLGLTFSTTVLNFPPARKALAASAPCNLGPIEATIVCDGTAQNATMLVTAQKGGYLINGGSNAVFLNFAGNGIAGTNAQNTTGEVEILANPAMPVHVRPSCRVFSYQSATGSSVLYWLPTE